MTREQDTTQAEVEAKRLDALEMIAIYQKLSKPARDCITYIAEGMLLAEEIAKSEEAIPI